MEYVKAYDLQTVCKFDRRTHSAGRFVRDFAFTTAGLNGRLERGSFDCIKNLHSLRKRGSCISSPGRESALECHYWYSQAGCKRPEIPLEQEWVQLVEEMFTL